MSSARMQPPEPVTPLSEIARFRRPATHSNINWTPSLHNTTSAIENLIQFPMILELLEYIRIHII
jgi:hypothetical protein